MLAGGAAPPGGASPIDVIRREEGEGPGTGILTAQNPCAKRPDSSRRLGPSCLFNGFYAMLARTRLLLTLLLISAPIGACGGAQSRIQPPEFERVWGEGGIEASWLGIPLAFEVSTVLTDQGVEVAKGCVRVGGLHWCQSAGNER